MNIIQKITESRPEVPINTSAGSWPSSVVFQLLLGLRCRRGTHVPRLGVEVFQEKRWECLAPSAWFALVDWLADQGWCLASKVSGLKARAGPEAVFTADGVVVLRSGINHLKLAAHEIGVEVKAYMAFALLGA